MFNRKQGLLKKPFVMYTFLAIQLVVFLLMEVNGGSTNSAVVVQFGGQYAPFIIDSHEYWRFITPIFVHIGWEHIALNSVMLYFLGPQVEEVYGHVRFFVLYLLSGVAGNILSFALHDSNIVGAGASTSLFGLFGAFIILRRYFPHNLAFVALAKQYILLVGINLGMNIFMPSVDIWGHLGGFVGGVLLGMILAIPNQRSVYPLWERALACLLLLVFYVGFLAFGFLKFRVL